MSAAATAAGYLYASGRLRGRTKEEGEEAEKPATRRRPIRVAALPERAPEHRDVPAPAEPAPRARPAVRVEYRTRRWRPDGT